MHSGNSCIHENVINNENEFELESVNFFYTYQLNISSLINELEKLKQSNEENAYSDINKVRISLNSVKIGKENKIEAMRRVSSCPGFFKQPTKLLDNGNKKLELPQASVGAWIFR